MKRIKQSLALAVTMIFMLHVAVFPVFALEADALPTGGEVVSGSGDIAVSGTEMTIHQNTDYLKAQWDSFDIGSNAGVTFLQPGSSSLAVNQISNQSPSQIFGSLTANGQVYLINSAGIIFGESAQVDTGGLVASSLDLNADTLIFEKTGSAGEIVNRGTIRGGYVALIGPHVINQGIINADSGQIAMIAADKVNLDFDGDQLINYTISEGTINALAQNKGLLRADGGLVVMTAEAKNELTSAVVNNEGIIEARTIAEKNGRILLLSDMKNGETLVGGTLDASAPSGGDGGFIETSAAHVSISEDVVVTTKSEDGKTGEWLIDPVNITVAAAAGDVTGTAIATALESTNVTLDTSGTGSCTGVACGALGGADGDIVINDDIIVSNDLGATRTLTFKADRDIELSAGKSINATGGGNDDALNVVFWSDSDGNGDGQITLDNGSSILSNSGHVWLGGGDGSTTWNSLTVGDDYAFGNAADTNGVYLNGTSVVTGGGNLAVYGKAGLQAAAGGDGSTTNNGIHFSMSNAVTLNSGTGTVYLNGVGQASGTDEQIGIMFNSSGIGVNHLVTSAAVSGDAVTLTGQGGVNATWNSNGIQSQRCTITATGGGNIVLRGIEGKTTSTYWGAIQFNNNTAVNSNAGNLTIQANTLALAGAATLSGSGILTIEPTTVGTTINLASSAADDNTLSIANGSFTSNFSDGFSSIVIGSASAGTINVGNATFSYRDPLTLKTNGSIFLNSSSVFSGSGNGIVLWSRAGGNNAADDANEGSVWLPVGSSITTGGGDVTIGGGADSTIGYAFGDDASTSAENNARYRGVTVNGTVNAGGGDIIINGRGNAGVAARGVSIGGTVQTSGTGNITIRGIAKGSSDALALGDSTVGIDGTVSAVNGTVTLTGTKDTGDAIEISTAASKVQTTGTGNVVLTSISGNINAITGYIVSGGTTSVSAPVTEDIVLTNTSNDFTGAVSVSAANDVSIVDSNAMILGAVTSTGGAVDIATLTGDLTLTGAVTTTNTGAAAVILNAGKSTAAGTSTGGNIVISGGSVTTGAGGRAVLYSGDISDSTGLTALVGSGSGNFRYNSDETDSNYSTALSSGKYAIFREQPIITVTANDHTQEYSGTAYSGGNGVTVSGTQNGDTTSQAYSGAVYGGSSQGATAVGTYVITPSGGASLLGYALSYANGALTISAASSGSNSSPESSSNEDVDTVVQSLTSFQRALNGTQDTKDSSSGSDQSKQTASGLYTMGPGSGSKTIDMFSMFKLIEDRTRQDR